VPAESKRVARLDVVETVIAAIEAALPDASGDPLTAA
jgi:hypothetical protein